MNTISYFKFLLVVVGITVCAVVGFNIIYSMDFGFGTQLVSIACSLLALVIYHDMSRDDGAHMPNYGFLESPFPEILIGAFFVIVMVIWGSVVELFSHSLHYDFPFWKYLLHAGMAVVFSGTAGYAVGYLVKNEERLLFA